MIAKFKDVLLSIWESCDPDIFYWDIRSWFRSADLDPGKKKWIFEGLGGHPDLKEPNKLSGPSTGQSPLLHMMTKHLANNVIMTGH